MRGSYTVTVFGLEAKGFLCSYNKTLFFSGLPDGWEKIESPNFGVYYVKYVT